MNLSRQHKPVVVYVAPKRRFLTVKVFDDLKHVLAVGDSNSVERVVSELHLEISGCPSSASGADAGGPLTRRVVLRDLRSEISCRDVRPLTVGQLRANAVLKCPIPG